MPSWLKAMTLLYSLLSLYNWGGDMSFTFDKFMKKILKIEDVKNSRTPEAEADTPGKRHYKKYGERWQNRITWRRPTDVRKVK